MIPVARAIAARRDKRVVIAMFAQGGKSETLLDVVGHRLDESPAPVLTVGPSKQWATEQFEPRVMELLDQSPRLRGSVARGKRMTKTRKVIAGVPWRLAHGGSSTALKSDPAGLAITDEADELMANVKGQGDPIALIDRRGETRDDFVHAIFSTPSVGTVETETDAETGLEFWRYADPAAVPSTIWRLFQSGTRHHFAWRCPHCREWFIPRRTLLRYPAEGTATDILTGAYVECPRCEAAIFDDQRLKMNAAGRYVAPGQTIDKDGRIGGREPDVGSRTFWVSGLCSPFKTFGERALALAQAERAGDVATMQAVVNGVFGECHSSATGEAPAWQSVLAGRSIVPLGVVPQQARLLTLAVDVQKRALVYAVRAWGARATSWGVDSGYLHGATAEAQVWEQLADLLHERWNGRPVKLALIDSGFNPGGEAPVPLNRVYEFCRKYQRFVFPAKGASRPQRVPVTRSRIEVDGEGKADSYGLELWRIDTDWTKSFVHERLAFKPGEHGRFNVAADASEDYCRQIVAEARTILPTGKPKWIARARDNHFLDAEAMNCAMAWVLNMQRIQPGAIDEQFEDEDADEVVAPPLAKPADAAPVSRLTMAERMRRLGAGMNAR